LNVAGMFGVTMVFNVPLNNALAAADPASAEGGDVWSRYQRDWTLWNTIRTVASIGAWVCFMWAIAAR
ncbi:anthrone oxygenase family protein, partial [Rhizobiaceae sp. 2RAB30]